MHKHATLWHQHLETDLVFSCPECGMLLSNRDSLREHLNRKHLIKNVNLWGLDQYAEPDGSAQVAGYKEMSWVNAPEQAVTAPKLVTLSLRSTSNDSINEDIKIEEQSCNEK